MHDSKTPRLQRLSEAIEIYLRAQNSHVPVSRQELLAQHPDLAELLTPLLDSLDSLESPVSPPSLESLAPDGNAAPASLGPSPANRELGDFVLMREIGRGGMGVVFEARQSSLDRRVALKVLTAHLTLQPSTVARFKREALAAARLDHKGIVKVLGVGSEAETHYFAMELIEGAQLDAFVRGAMTQASPRRSGHIAMTVELIAKVADALHYAHEAGVVHRDVKPSNILVREDGTPVVTDFGLAHDASLPSLTQTGAFAGTLHYVAPERVAGGSHAVDARSDVFSLGATLYELLTNRRPFEAPTTQAVLAHILHDEPEDPQRLNPDLAPDLAAIVLKALAKDPERRYQSAKELASDLRAFLAYRPVLAKRQTPRERVLRWARREPAKAALVLLLLIALPAITGLLGVLLANRYLYDAGRAKLLHDQKEQLLARGFVDAVTRYPRPALESFNALRALAPDDLEALAGTSIARLNLAGPRAALEVLDERAQLVNGSGALRRLRGSLLQLGGRLAEAEAIARTLGEPESPLELFMTGFCELHLSGRKTPAKTRSALALLFRAVLASREARAAYYFEWATAAEAARDETHARHAASAIGQLWPESSIGWNVAGLTLMRFDPERAALALERSIALDPSDHRPRMNKALLLSQTGRMREAVQLMRAELERRPEDLRIWSNLGVVLGKLGEWREAAAAHEKCVELNREPAEDWNDLGVARDKLANADGACEAFERAVAADPNFAIAHGNLGDLLRRRGDLGRALPLLERAVELDPLDADLRCMLGKGYEAQRDGEREVAAYRAAIEMDPSSERAHVSLLAWLAQRDERENVRVELERWVTIARERAEAWIDLAWFHVDPENVGVPTDPARGYAAAERALRLTEGRDPRAIQALAEANFARGEFELGIRVIEQCKQSVGGAALMKAEAMRDTLEDTLRRLRRALARATASRPQSR